MTTDTTQPRPASLAALAAVDPVVRARVRGVVERVLGDVMLSARWSSRGRADERRLTQIPGYEQLVEAVVDGVFDELGRADPHPAATGA